MAYRYSVRKGVERIKTKTSLTFSAIILGLTGLGMAIAVPLAGHAVTPPAWNVNGAYTIDFEYQSGHYVHEANITNENASGDFDIAGGYPAGGTHTYDWAGTGNVTGNSITVNVTYSGGPDATGTVMTMTGSINPANGTMSGNWHDNYGGGSRDGTWATATGAAQATTSSTVVVTGNTSAGENQPGWLFNRDVTTSTPYEFNTDQHSIGTGSLFVKPIGANASDKFVAENFLKTKISDIGAISYDFLVAGNGTSGSANQFYLNVYANIINDNKFYDCRFDYVPATASTSNFTTATFDPSSTPANVQTSGTARTVCPATLAGMPAGSYVRAFSISVGDTSTSDIGLAGYLDKVVVATTTNTTTYDFEAISAPTIFYPANNSVKTVAQSDKIDWTDVSGATTYEYRAFSDAGYTSLVYASTPLAVSEIPTPNTPPGQYYVQVRALNATSTSAWSNGATNPYHLTVIANPVVVTLTNKDQCKNDGWKTSTNPVFKNQGDCVSYFATKQKNPANG